MQGQDLKRVILGGLGLVVEYRIALANALAIPFVLLVGLNASQLIEIPVNVRLGLSLLGIIVHTIFAVTTHRITLLGPQSVSRWGIFSWSRRETSFFLHLFGLGFMMVPLAVLAIIPVVGWTIAFGAMFWLAGRLSLVFPAIAVDHEITFKKSWQMTDRHQALMLFVVIVFPLLLSAPAILLATWIPAAFLVTSVLTSLSTVFTVATLSAAYRFIYQDVYEK
jgi:hypothetical protein